MRLTNTLIAAATAGILISTPLVIAEANPNAKEIMHDRHENFEAIGAAFKTVRDELRGGKADMGKVQMAADKIAGLAPELTSWFPEGTGPETGIDTESKAEIWSDWATFEAAANKLVDESKKFAELAQSGEAAKVMGGMRGLGGACKNCHDNFREED